VSALSLLREIAHESGIAVLCSLHQVDLVPGLADRVLGLRASRLVTDNTVEHFQILANRQIYVASEGKFVG
jgi:phosphonate transport system ATP-binding protein